jgi:hypothetical protein
MASTIVAFTATDETLATAVQEATHAASAWLAEQRVASEQVRSLHASTITDVSRATGAMMYSHIVTLLVDLPPGA